MKNELSARLVLSRDRPMTRRSGALQFISRYRVALVLVFLLVFPLIMPYQALAVNILIYGLFALGFNLLFGYTGLLSFGHAAFFGAGAYATGIAVVHLDMPWFGALAFGVAVSGLVAMALGALAIRSRGIYFAMVTLALSQLVYYGVYQMSGLSGGENGLRGIDVYQVSVFGLTLDLINPTVKYYFMLLFVGPALWIFSRILSSPFGATLEAIRENENRARACGYDVTATKWVAFVLSGLFCGLAGALMAIHLSVVPIETLHYHTSGVVVMMSLLGGMGTFFGPFAGALAYLLLEDLLTMVTGHWQLYLGAIFIIFVLFFPKGIWGTLLEKLRR